jgi:hypothetical protein
MSIQLINTGSSNNAGDGDTLRSAFNKINYNFTDFSNSLTSISTTISSLTGINDGFPSNFVYYNESNNLTNTNALRYLESLNLIILGSFVNTSTRLYHLSEQSTGSFATFAQHHNDTDSSNFTLHRTRGTAPLQLPAQSGDDIADISFTTINQSNTLTGVANITVSVVSTSTGGHTGIFKFYLNQGTYTLPTEVANLTSSSTWKVDYLDSFTPGTSLQVRNNLLPAENLTYDLGSTSSQWRSLYVGTSTIYIGGTPVTLNLPKNTLVVGTVTNTATTLATESYAQQRIEDLVTNRTEISIGNLAGNHGQGDYSVAIGSGAGRLEQGTNAISIGNEAGNQAQGNSAIAIGRHAGNIGQGDNAIAIGYSAGFNAQSANSIILNATSATLNSSNSGFFVSPIRTSVLTTYGLYYNAETKEITTSTGGGGGGISDRLTAGSYSLILGSDSILTAPGNILPDADLAYDLGSTSSQWRSLYVGTGTIYINGIPLSINTNSSLTVNGLPVVSYSTSGSFIVDGNSVTGASTSTGDITFSNNVVQGTGYELGLSPGTNFTTNTQYFRIRGGDVAEHLHFDTTNNYAFDLYLGDDQKYFKLSKDGPAIIGTQNTVTSALSTWIFDTNGTLTLPSNLSITPAGNFIPVTGTAMLQGTDEWIFIVSSGTNATTQLGWADDPFAASQSASISFNANNSGEVRILTGSFTSTINTWAFGINGELTFPDGTTQTTAAVVGNQAVATTSTLVNGTYTVSLSNLGLTQFPVFEGGSLFIQGAELGSAISSIGISAKDNVFITANILDASKQWAFNTNGNLTFPDGTSQTTAHQSNTGSWILSPGTNTVSFTVDANAAYTMWVNGNIPNGIVVWNATVSLSNTNVPAVGTQYGWYYAAGNELVLDSMPNQIIGTAGAISSATVATTSSNVFTFGITNNSTTTQIVNWGYVKI